MNNTYEIDMESYKDYYASQDKQDPNHRRDCLYDSLKPLYVSIYKMFYRSDEEAHYFTVLIKKIPQEGMAKTWNISNANSTVQKLINEALTRYSCDMTIDFQINVAGEPRHSIRELDIHDSQKFYKILEAWDIHWLIGESDTKTYHPAVHDPDDNYQISTLTFRVWNKNMSIGVGFNDIEKASVLF